MAEPGVTLTDYALALESALLAWCLHRTPTSRPKLRTILTRLYLSGSLAALLGGTVHGFLPNPRSPAHQLLWRLTLSTIGLTAFATEMLASHLLGSRPAEDNGSLPGHVPPLKLAFYTLAIILRPAYTLTLLNGLISTLFLLVSFITLWLRTRARAALLGLASIALAILAAGVQQERIALHRRYFDHNALYHLIQGLAMLVFYKAARRLLARP